MHGIGKVASALEHLVDVLIVDRGMSYIEK
jgi:hypothetical protein